MSRLVARLLVGASASLLFVMAGCALDPMERLSEQIDSQDVKVRQAAVLELANLRDDRAIDALAEVLDGDEEVYDMAGVALVKQGRENVTDKKPDPVITRLSQIMNNMHTPEANRARAAWALGEIGDREAIPALRGGTGAKLPSGDPAPAVQEQAKLALKKLGNDSDGAAFELPMSIFKTGRVAVLPEVKPVGPPPEAEEPEPKPKEGKAGETEGGKSDKGTGAAKKTTDTA